MSEEEINSWIFLAIAMASSKEPVNQKAISAVADGINHAVPTNHELQSSISWLLQQNLINKNADRYSLTEKGKELYQISSANSNLVMSIWKGVEEQFYLLKEQ